METADDTLDLDLDQPERWLPPLDKGQRLFRLALAAAVLLHAALFVEVGRSLPRTIGDPSGRPDAIAVDLVTEADLRSRETVALPPTGAAQPPAAAPAPDPTPEPEAAEAAKPAEAAPPQQKPAEPAEAPAKDAPSKATPDTAQQTAALPDFETTFSDLATAPPPRESETAAPEPPQADEAPKTPAKPAEKQSPPAKKKPASEARLDPALPDVQNAPPGRSTAATRPPGITRSGENDEFGRAVIRALRQTMPPPRGIFGRVTVRLVLTENGDLGQVQVLAPSGTSLDQSVVFATKQTYFPLPPYNATLADRTFLITYVYR